MEERKESDMVINKLITPYNYSEGQSSRIQYIVIHYVGATGGAEANCRYYASRYVGASAHYFVGFDGEIWQSVEDHNIAWHVGSKTYRHKECRNSNSIGIELCVRNKGSQAATSRDWYFEDATVSSAEELTRALMERYQVPADHILRHYDVTGKICPNPYVYNHTSHTWDQFKQALTTPLKSGWHEEDGHWRYYLGNTGSYVKDDWYEADGSWYWFNGAGYMVTNTWKTGSDNQWYYLTPSGPMAENQWILWNSDLYRATQDGSLFRGTILLESNSDGALIIKETSS